MIVAAGSWVVAVTVTLIWIVARFWWRAAKTAQVNAERERALVDAAFARITSEERARAKERARRQAEMIWIIESEYPPK